MTRVFKFPAGSSLDEVLGIIEGTHVIKECFTHIDDNNKLTRKFDVSGINAYCVEHLKPYDGVITEQGYITSKTQRGYEQHRLDAITQEIIDKNPLTFIVDTDRQLLMIDGTHRYIKAWDLGNRTIRAYVVEPDIWQNYLMPVDNISAEDLLKSPSGL